MDRCMACRRNRLWVIEVAQAGLQEPVIESKLRRSWLQEDISQETILVAQVKAKIDVDRVL